MSGVDRRWLGNLPVGWRRYGDQVVKVVADLADHSIVGVGTTRVRP